MDIIEKTEQQLVQKVSDKRFGMDALLIAGAIVFGSLIVAVSVFSLQPKTAIKTNDVKATDTKATNDQDTAKQGASVTMDQVKALFDGKNISFGDKESKVIFIEFSDPSCPYCNLAAGKNPSLNKQAGSQFTMAQDGGSYIPPIPEMKKLVDAGKAAYVWLYANGHGNGELGAKALYCAHEQGKFWAVHDLLMSAEGYALMNNDVKNDMSKVGKLAAFLKGAADQTKLQSCLESGKYDSQLTADESVAEQFGFSGTPSFFVNTENLTGAHSFKDFQPLVEKYSGK